MLPYPKLSPEYLPRPGHLLLLLCLAFLLSACSRPPEGIGKAVSWSALKGWKKDNHAEVWPALLQSCKALEKKKPEWKLLCAEARKLQQPGNAQARVFFETYFVPHKLINSKGRRQGTITGYFFPTLQGSNIRDKIYKYPVYRRPPDMITVDLRSQYPDKLAGMRLRGRLIGTRLIPYYSRAEIDKQPSPLKGHEIVWVKDPIALFFMHIQGSGYIRLTNNKIIAVGYADQNGYPYYPVGRELVKSGALQARQISLQSIREWMVNNPGGRQALMNTNPSYVFFRVMPAPTGSLGVPLSSGRSIAVDRRKIPLGLPVWIETRYPDIKSPGSHLQRIMKQSKSRLRRLFMAQDTGGAIAGGVRADIFWGEGKDAELLAGHMNQKGKMYLLVPKK